MTKFILFDIDGTLIDSAGAGAHAFALAFEELTGIPDGFRGINFAGKTDLLILKEVQANWGLPPVDAWLSDFLDLYVKHLERTVVDAQGHIKDGVLDLLPRLKHEDDFVLGLLTGNVERGARIKLERFALHSHFLVGAYGSDHEDRDRLLPVAVKRLAGTNGTVVDFADCVVVGDTPRDVSAAHASGASCLAVATGPFSVAQLAQEGADAAISDLTNVDWIVAWLRQVSGRSRRA